MCSSVPVLRLVAFLFLLVAFLACSVGFLSPFWIEYHSYSSISSASSASSPQPSDAPPATPSSPATPSTSSSTFTVSSQTNQVPKVRNNTVRNGDPPPEMASEQKAPDGREEEEQRKEDDDEGDEVVNVTSVGRRRMFEGLWARCDENFNCSCFAQDNFQMEKDFPVWHKAVQGLFTIGLLFLLITLLIGGCYLCCRCCKESVALATVLGVFALVGFLPIALSIVLYGGFANHSRNIEMVGDGDRFAWGYFLSIAGALVVPLAALLYFLDGRRKEIIEHEDCETAKMV